MLGAGLGSRGSVMLAEVLDDNRAAFLLIALLPDGLSFGLYGLRVQRRPAFRY